MTGSSQCYRERGGWVRAQNLIRTARWLVPQGRLSLILVSKFTMTARRHLSGSVRREAQVLIVTAISRIPLWLLSGWGCQGQRLSTAQENPDTQLGTWRCRPASRRRGLGRDGRERRSHNSITAPDGPEFSGTRQRRAGLDARSGKPQRGCTQDTN